jgi:hypothetical protein
MPIVLEAVVIKDFTSWLLQNVAEI